jgi:hypothetical protein
MPTQVAPLLLPAQVVWNKLDFLLALLGVLDLAWAGMPQFNFLRILRIFRVGKLIVLVRAAPRAGIGRCPSHGPPASRSTRSPASCALTHTAELATHKSCTRPQVRSARLAQLVKSVKGINSLFSTLVYSLPAFGNVGALIGIFFFMYAYIGTFAYGKMDVGPNSINRHVNFHNFFQSTLTLLRVATGDNWTGIMLDCIGATYAAIPYFTTFVLLISVILLNLFMAVIIETFEKTHEQEEWKLSPEVRSSSAPHACAMSHGRASSVLALIAVVCRRAAHTFRLTQRSAGRSAHHWCCCCRPMLVRRWRTS